MEQSRDVETVVRRMYDAIRQADHETVAELVAEEGVVFIGTDAEEWWQDDVSELREVFRQQLEAADGFDVLDERPAGYSEGDIGWFADQPSMRLGDGTVVPMRHTGVLRRLDGEWFILQSHLSVGANINERLFEA